MKEINFKGRRKDNNEFVYGPLILRNCDGFERAYIYDADWDETEIVDYDDLGKIHLKECFIEVIPRTVRPLEKIVFYYQIKPVLLDALAALDSITWQESQHGTKMDAELRINAKRELRRLISEMEEGGELNA